MPRVHTQTARKDYPAQGIAKGDVYYSWKFRHGPKMRSKTRPRASQLTQSDKLSRSYSAEETLHDDLQNCDSIEDIAQALNDAAAEVRDIASEYNESADNIEQAFTGGSATADECREKADSLESWADELEQAASDVEGLDREDFEDDNEMMDDAREKAYEPSCPI